MELLARIPARQRVGSENPRSNSGCRLADGLTARDPNLLRGGSSIARFRPCISGIWLFSYAWCITDMGRKTKEDIPRVAKKRNTLLGRTYIFVGNNDVTAAVRGNARSFAPQL